MCALNTNNLKISVMEKIKKEYCVGCTVIGCGGVKPESLLEDQSFLVLNCPFIAHAIQEEYK